MGDTQQRVAALRVARFPGQFGKLDAQAIVAFQDSQQFILLGWVERLLGLVDQRIDFRVFVTAQLTPTGAIWPEWKKRTMAYSGSEVT